MSRSNNPNSPQLPHFAYTIEKGYFAGTVMASVFYGIATALFFQCMGALLHPIHPTTKGVKWGLVAHTVAMFSFLTIGGTINRDIFSHAYVDDRGFSGVDGLPTGPSGYQAFAYSTQNTISVVASLMFPFNQWLADGLLLYRCHVIYSMNYWVIAFPGLMYLATIGTGILSFYLQLVQNDLTAAVSIAYYLISLALNVLLTLMIIVRLVLHNKNIRNAIGASSGPGGLYTAVVTMLVESSALYAVAYLLYIVPTAASSYVGFVFTFVGEIQVIAPLLIILRVANRSALTSEAVASGAIDSFRFRSEGDMTDDSETLPDEHPHIIETNGETSGELALGARTG